MLVEKLEMLGGEGMGWGCQPLSMFISTAAGPADSPNPLDGAGHRDVKHLPPRSGRIQRNPPSLL